MIKEEYRKEEERDLLEAKVFDKYKSANSKNKVTNTDFLNQAEKKKIEKFLCSNKFDRYFFFGGNGENSDRNIVVFYPDKISSEMAKTNLKKILSVIKIELPKDTVYEHKMYLSGIMKLGVKREKIGDILIKENKAEIIVLNEIKEFLVNGLTQLTRFRKAKIEIINIDEVEQIEPKFDIINCIVTSMRLDNFVSEIARCSRTKSIELIEAQRVFVNYDLETKFSKKINIGDIINVRGKGKVIIDSIENKTKSDRYVIKMKKFS